MIPFQPGLYRPDLHYQGEWPGIHYVAFTKTPLVHSCSLGFASRTNAVHHPRWVTNKTKSNDLCTPLGKASTTPRPPLMALWQSQLYPQVHLINQLRASHSTLMVALCPGGSLHEQVLTERNSGKWLESPGVSQDHQHNQDNSIIS
jgi:hypothetical protein